MPRIKYNFPETDQIPETNPPTWNPEGVCLVVGSDESEESTVLAHIPGIVAWDNEGFSSSKHLRHRLERWHTKSSMEKWDAFIKEAQLAFPQADLTFPFKPGTARNNLAALFQLGLVFHENLENLENLARIFNASNIMGIENFGDHLTPRAIRSIIRTMRKQADECDDLTIVLTTHSPIVMDEFKNYEDQFFVMQEGHPVALDEAYDPNWLAHFSLGDLYAREQIG